jgi:hypothetical protein
MYVAAPRGASVSHRKPPAAASKVAQLNVGGKRESWSNCSCTFRRPDPQGAACMRAALAAKNSIFRVFSAPSEWAAATERCKKLLQQPDLGILVPAPGEIKCKCTRPRSRKSLGRDNEKTAEKVEQGNDF